MNIEIGDRVVWKDPDDSNPQHTVVGEIANIVGNTAIMKCKFGLVKVNIANLVLEEMVNLTREDYRKKVLSVADDAGCNEDTEEANALREIANVLFEQLEIALFGECDKALECFSNKTSD